MFDIFAIIVEIFLVLMAVHLLRLVDIYSMSKYINYRLITAIFPIGKGGPVVAFIFYVVCQ